jgi:putative transposase
MLGAIPDTSISGKRVARELTTIIERRANPCRTAMSILQQDQDEGFNGKLRDELLNKSMFTSLDQARSLLAAWKHDYNYNPPHSKLGWLTPSEFAQSAAPAKAMATGAAILDVDALMAIAASAQQVNNVTCSP